MVVGVYFWIFLFCSIVLCIYYTNAKNSPTLFFFRIVLDILGPLYFHKNLMISLQFPKNTQPAGIE